MTWNPQLHKAWTIGCYRDAEESRLAAEARRAGGTARLGRRRWRFRRLKETGTVSPARE